MTSSIDVRVLFFAMDEGPAPELAKMAARRGWPFVQTTTVNQAIGEVRRQRPWAVIVQVSLHLDKELELLYRVRAGFSYTTLIAVATTHYEDIERAVRSAGVSLYLPSARDAGQVEQTVDQVLDHRESKTSAVMPVKHPSARPEKALSSSASFPPSP